MSIIKKATRRDSGIELLKIISIIMIVISHATPDGNIAKHASAVDITYAGQNIQLFFTSLLHNLGQIGNVIFIACSSYFLIDSTKTKVKKMLYIAGDCLAISILMYVLLTLVFGFHHSTAYTIRQFFPLLYVNNWFIPCYLLVYSLHPIMNAAIKNINQKQHLTLVLIFLIIYSFIHTVIIHVAFYNRLLAFIGIYFTIGYIKIYMNESAISKKHNIILLICGTVGWIVTMLITNFTPNGVMLNWNTMVNPWFIIMALSAFNLSKGMSFYNTTINYISGMSLYIYVIHCNRIVRDKVRFVYYDIIKDAFGYDNLIFWIMVYSLITLAASVILSIIYNSLIRERVNRLADFVGKPIEKIYNNIVNAIIKLK